MDWEARFKEGLDLSKAGEFAEAGEIYNEVAEATWAPPAVHMTILTKLILARFYISNMGRQFVTEDSFEDIDIAIKWVDVARDNDDISSQLGEEFLRDSRKECCEIKGQMLFMLDKPECEEYLKEAASLECNQARVFLGLYYKNVAGAILDSENAKNRLDEVEHYYRLMSNTLEKYIENYDPKEAEMDELKLAANLVAYTYEAGMGVPKSLETAGRYKYIADTFDKETKTSAPISGYRPRSASASKPVESMNAKQSGGCYVATAVYGSYDCPEVRVLRRFRDYRLRKTNMGRLFIKIYYAVSPRIVSAFSGHSWFNKCMRKFLDSFVVQLREKGYSDSSYDDRA